MLEFVGKLVAIRESIPANATMKFVVPNGNSEVRFTLVKSAVTGMLECPSYSGSKVVSDLLCDYLAGRISA